MIDNKNIITNLYRTEAYDSKMCAYFCTGFYDFMLNNRILEDLANLIFVSNFKKTDEINSNVFEIYNIYWMEEEILIDGKGVDNFIKNINKKNHFIKYNKYIKLENLKTSNNLMKILLHSIIGCKYGNNNDRIFKEKESTEMPKIILLTDNMHK